MAYQIDLASPISLLYLTIILSQQREKLAYQIDLASAIFLTAFQIAQSNPEHYMTVISVVTLKICTKGLD